LLLGVTKLLRFTEGIEKRSGGGVGYNSLGAVVVVVSGILLDTLIAALL